MHSNDGIIYETIDFSNNVAEQLCNVLYRHNLQSVFIEGGKRTLETFIDANLWDEARIFIGDALFKKGLKAPKISGNAISDTTVKSDLLKIIRNK